MVQNYQVLAVMSYIIFDNLHLSNAENLNLEIKTTGSPCRFFKKKLEFFKIINNVKVRFNIVPIIDISFVEN